MRKNGRGEAKYYEQKEVIERFDVIRKALEQQSITPSQLVSFYL